MSQVFQTTPDRTSLAQPVSDTHYQVLQVARTAHAAVIEAAYLALLRLASTELAEDHPAAPARLEVAYRILRNPDSRSAYDRELAARSTVEPPSGEKEPQTAPQSRCWRCDEPLDPSASCCDSCRWLTCSSCASCGCDYLNRQNGQAESSRRPLHLLGWGLGATVAGAIVALVVLLIVSRQNHLPPPLAAAPPLAEPTLAVAASPLPLERAVSPNVAQPGTAPSRPPAPTSTAAPSPAPTLEPPTPKRSSLIASNGQGARLRAEPNVRSNVLEVLPDNTEVTELGDDFTAGDRTWRRITTLRGAEGWVDAGLLRPAASG